MAEAGTPVQAETTSATSEASTCVRAGLPSTRTREAASSSRSMALSGRYLSQM